MQISFIITYKDVSNNEYEDTAYSKTEAESLRDSLYDEGFVDVQIERVRMK